MIRYKLTHNYFHEDNSKENSSDIIIHCQGSPSDEKWGETGGDSPPTKEKLQKSPPISPH